MDGNELHKSLERRMNEGEVEKVVKILIEMQNKEKNCIKFQHPGVCLFLQI